MLPGIAGISGKASGSNYAIEYLGVLSWSSGNTISGSIDIGLVDSTKEIFLVSVAQGSATRTLTAATTTVDGEAVTKATTNYTFDNGGGPPAWEIAAAFVAMPTQAGSVTITATYSGTLTGGRVAVYKVVARPGIGDNESDADPGGSTTNAVTTNATTIAVNEFWLGAAICFGDAETLTTGPTGTITDTTENWTATVSARVAFSHRAVQAVESTPTDTWTFSSGDVDSDALSWAFG
jgi:hypothetical protein